LLEIVLIVCVFLQVTVLTLELDSPTLPAGKKIVFDLKATARLADTKKNPIIIKEGVEYK
jgi:Rho GDP-dissociation inhibitor